jgi:hypothetical protein
MHPDKGHKGGDGRVGKGRQTSASDHPTFAKQVDRSSARHHNQWSIRAGSGRASMPLQKFPLI